MSIPNFDIENISDSNGKLTPQAKLLFDQIITILQKTLSDQGLQVPYQPTSNISQYDPSTTVATIIYDSTTNQFKGNVGGVYKTFTLT